MSENAKKFRFAIDRGGTFTDVFAITPDDKIVTLKLLSENEQFYPDAPTYAIKKIIAQETGTPIQEGLINPENIEWIRMGTTVATNALLEGKGEDFCLVITKGFRDLLYIGNQSRPNLFDLSIEMPNMLYKEVIEVEERVAPFNKTSNTPPEKIIDLPNEQKIEILTDLNLEQLEKDLIEIRDKKNITNIAVLLIHSYLYHEHESKIGELASRLGFTNISLSHQISSMIRAVPRGLTTSIDAYLTPCIDQYLKSFRASFSSDVNVLFMQSDGGLTSINNFRGCRAILSGPAGGVVGYALTSYDKQPVIGFDMGGTSTDVSRYDGKYEHVFETLTAGYTIQTPQLDINTIAAGGGSMLFFRAGMFVVGPESASSNPGPACYKKVSSTDGPLTITDANLILGRLLPEFFPKIFGINQDEALDYEVSYKLFESLTNEINFYQRSKNLTEMTIEEVAMGFVKVANEAMCRPIRNLTEGKGYDTRKHLLACFGGAGGQHACAIARSLGIKRIVVNRFSGILSAYGLSLADVVHESQEPCSLDLNEENLKKYVIGQVDHLKSKCIKYLIEKENFKRENIKAEVYLNLRYHGTDTGIMCTIDESESSKLKAELFEQNFLKKYKEEYGFVLNRGISIDDVRVRGVGMTKNGVKTLKVDIRKEGQLKAVSSKRVYFDDHKFLETNLFRLEDILVDDIIEGPAIIIDKNSTVLIEPGCTAFLNEHGDVLIDIKERASYKAKSSELDTTQLSIFSHRFMSIAEQMGRILQRTAVSTNIKERLDYSCAMFDSNGGLVANAPHIPVHLGAMQEAVKFQIEYSKQNPLKPGDVLLSNHPACGGSHLPDLTVITPVFNNQSDKPVFFVANRGHHADIGGLTPGSMPPHSTKLWQEGASFKSLKIVENNVFNEEELIEAFKEPGKYPNCSGSRNLSDNLSDLKAQVAANNKGIELINQLIDEYQLDVVLSYMGHIQQTAEQSVKDLMKIISLNCDNKSEDGETGYFKAQEYMDDGSNLDLEVTIRKDGSSKFDFTGTSYQVNGNCNTPRAITLSAIIYCIRCMIKFDMPLNQGCLKPIEIIIPEGSILSPSEESAVVGGNVLTSQRIVDLIFKTFKICAASQGCMNNITFGNEKGGYYETVGGGAGAGPTWHGRHGVHTHMTNTRITDVEILEKRYPIILKTFSLRKNSGGKGIFNGGDGLIREFIFRDYLELCVLTERRVFQPYGLYGGQPGAKGRNTLIKKNGLHINLGSKSKVDIEPGDLFRLETPGAGGYGEVANQCLTLQTSPESLNRISKPIERGSLNQYSAIQQSV